MMYSNQWQCRMLYKCSKCHLVRIGWVQYSKPTPFYLNRHKGSNATSGSTSSWFHVAFGIITGSIIVASWLSQRSKVKYARQHPRQRHKEDNWRKKYRKIQKQYLVSYKGYKMPSFYMDERETIENLPIEKGDIFVASFPKAGTTWVQEIVYLLQKGAHTTSAENIESRFPYLEYLYPGPKDVAKREHPWLIKTHVPYCMLPKEVKKAKVVYVARNPKDTSVSMTYFMKMVPFFEFKGSFEDFFHMDFINDTYGYAPWWRHVTEYWKHREDENLMFITYEQLTRDPVGTIKQIADFLDIKVTSGEVQIIAERTSFSNMKNDDTVNYSWWSHLGLADKNVSQFMRKGKVGDWNNHYTQEMSDWVDDMVQEKVTPTGLNFVYQIHNSQTADITPTR